MVIFILSHLIYRKSPKRIKITKLHKQMIATRSQLTIPRRNTWADTLLLFRWARNPKPLVHCLMLEVIYDFFFFKSDQSITEIYVFSDANPEFMFKLKLDEEAKGLTNRPLTLYTRINQPGATVKWTKGGQDLDVSFIICVVVLRQAHTELPRYKRN